MIFKYLNDSEYYHDSETIILIHILSIFHLWQRNQVLPCTIVRALQEKLAALYRDRSRKSYSFLSSHEYHVVVGIMRQNNVKCTCQ